MAFGTGSASLFSLEGKVAIVTGASRGIGFALAQGLATAGATVYGIARSPRPREPFVGSVQYVAGDVSKSIDAVIARIAADLGAINILVNAAGITLPVVSEDGSPIDNFSETIKVNLTGAYSCCVAARPFMGQGSSIINVTSIGSVLGFPGNPAYVAAKGGLRMLTKALAIDYGTVGIRVNALAPGYVLTDMTAKSFSDPQLNEQRRKHTCLDRWGSVDDLVGTAIFLASEASAYITGQDIFVDGGWTAKGMV